MITVCAAQLDDLPAITRLASEIWRQHYPGIISAEQIDYMLARMYDLEVMRSEVMSGVTYFRADAENALRGFAAVGPSENPHEFKLHKLYVLREWRSCGIGSRLLAAAERIAESKGATHLILNVNKKNPAVQAYQKVGFSIRDSVQVDIGSGFIMDDFVMTKPLGKLTL